MKKKRKGNGKTISVTLLSDLNFQLTGHPNYQLADYLNFQLVGCLSLRLDDLLAGPMKIGHQLADYLDSRLVGLLAVRPPPAHPPQKDAGEGAACQASSS